MKAEKLYDVAGHVAVVTGAASGLGLAIAEVLAENGARVTMLDKDGDRLEAEAKRLRAGGAAVEAVVLDVTDTERMRAAIDAAARQAGRLDVVFANAGISAGPGFTMEAGQLANVAMADWDRVLQVNLTSVFATMQAAAAHMKARRSGRIIVTSSVAGIVAEGVVGYAYAATKAAVNSLVRQAAMELAAHNVLVNAIAPGPFLTNIGGGRLQREPGMLDALKSRVPLGRIAHPDEIKGLALFLASPASSYLTGAVIPLDGGMTAC